MTASELMEWVAYNRLEPIDTEWRNELRNGTLISSIVNTLIRINTIKGKPKLYKPDDFMINFDKEKEYPDEKTLAKKLKSWAMAKKKRKING
jgi:hypothetical protein